MASFFGGHSHYTIFADNVSLFAEIFASVIQGSGVSPISYIVCASDLHPLTPANKMFKFADDTCLVIPASHIHTRELELLNVENWATQNNLNLNRAKSQEIVFEKPRCCNKLTVSSLPGVARVYSLKILVITLGSNFSFQMQRLWSQVFWAGIIRSANPTLTWIRQRRESKRCSGQPFRQNCSMPLLPGGGSPTQHRETAWSHSSGEAPKPDSTRPDLPHSASYAIYRTKHFSELSCLIQLIPCINFSRPKSRGHTICGHGTI